MSATSVFCFATSRTQAGQIVDHLKEARFSSSDISALFAEPPTGRDLAEVRHAKAPEGTVIGAGLGGVVGWMAGIGVFVIPGLGSFIDASPVLAVLSAVAMGTALGGLAGRLIGMGISVREKRRDGDEMRNESIRISVQAENSAEITRAEVIFAYGGGQGICTAAEATDLEDSRATEIITYPTARVKQPTAQALR